MIGVVVLNGLVIVVFLTFTPALAGLAGCCLTGDRYPFVSADHNYLQIRVFRHEKKKTNKTIIKYQVQETDDMSWKTK